MSERRQTLEDLLSHPGWALFVEHVKAEWSPGACWKRTIDGADKDLVHNTNVEVGKLMRWPSEEVEALMRQEQAHEPVLGRGGYHR